MPLYVTLYKFTDQGIKNVKDSPKRLEAGIRAAEQVGGKILGAYYTLGEYDLVVISEIGDEETGVAHTLAQNALGNVRSMTMRAFTPEQFAAILQKMP
ncbi:MAG: GYD domain-containing protein [Bryobacteraceae bacterium]